jgi:hypothetical protein
MEITLQAGATREARSAGVGGTEALEAKAEVESRAAVGPSMEAIVERDNLRKALAQVKRNKGLRACPAKRVSARRSRMFRGSTSCTSMSAVSIPTPITRANRRTIACGPSLGACSIGTRYYSASTT